MGTSGLGANFVSGTVRFLKICHPNEMLPRRKIRELEITGWERLSFLERCCFFSKIVTRKNRYDNQQVGTSGLGATLVSGILRLLKNWHPTEMLYKRKFASWDERAGSDFRFWNFAVSENVLRLKVGPDEKSISSNERAGSDFRFWNCVVSQTNVLLRKFGPE